MEKLIEYLQEIAKLTESQSKAADPSHDIIATAGAGTGKTRVLGARYLLTTIKKTNASGKAPKIVAMTFGEKAAAEMWERICEIAFKLHLRSKTKQSLQLYRSLEGADISTIHSFCYRLIARYPILAGVEPDFEVEAKEVVAEDLVEDYFSELANANPEYSEILLRVVSRYPRKYLRAMLLDFYGKRNIAHEALKKCAEASIDEMLPRYRDFLQSHASMKLEEFCNIIMERKDEIEKKAPRKSEIAKVCSWLLKNIIRAEKPIGVESISEIHKNISEAQLGHIDDRLKECREFFEKYLATIDGNIDEFVKDIHYISRIYLWFEEFIGYGHSRKKNLDYTDLLIYARDLLTKLSPEIRRSALPEHILVDEFQDTSPIQWEIIEILCQNCQKSFFVGDEKQSIYRFRGADVSVVRKGESFISSRNPSGIVGLSENYRTKPRLLKLLNRIFEGIFPKETEKPYMARFQHLNSAKEFNGEDDSHLCVVLPDESETSHAKIICNIVSSALEGKFLWGEGAKANPKDFLILARSREKVFEILRELRRANIPVIPLVESGFFEASEVKTIFFLLDFLADQRRNGALYALLRSPVFGLADSHIATVHHSEEGSLWKRICAFVQNHPYDSSMKKAFEMLSPLVESSRMKTADMVVEEFLSMDNVLSALCGSFPDIALENIEKLLSRIRTLSIGEGRTLSEIVQILKTEQLDDKVGYAHPIETANVVRVSTIHSAKGLQGRNVIVSDMSYREESSTIRKNQSHHSAMSCRKRSENSFYIGPELPFGFILKPLYADEENAFHYIAKQLNDEKNRAEFQRLLYVAATRAEDNLIVVADKKVDFFSKKIKDSLNDNPDGYVEKKYPDVGVFEGEKCPVQKPMAIDISKVGLRKTARKLYTVRQTAEIILEYSRDFPTDVKSRFDDELQSDLEWGNLVHRLLFYAPFKSSENAVEIAKNISSDARLSKVAQMFASSELNEKMLRSEVFSEVPLFLRQGDLTITGRADVIMLNPPTVLDYKTGEPQDTETKRFYDAQLNIYRHILAKWLGLNDAKVLAQIVWIGDEIYLENVEYCDEISARLSNLSITTL